MLNQRDVDPVSNVTLAQNFSKKIKKIARYQFHKLICYKTNAILLVVLV